jgi:hypothetical protein
MKVAENTTDRPFSFHPQNRGGCLVLFNSMLKDATAKIFDPPMLLWGGAKGTAQ